MKMEQKQETTAAFPISARATVRPATSKVEAKEAKFVLAFKLV